MLNESNGAVTFSVKVVPRASKNQIAGVAGDAIKVRLNAPPVEGKANDTLIAFLADALDVRRAQVEIVTGHTSRRKVVRVRGVSVQKVERKLMQK
jgi:hypothetical protein